MFLEKLGSVFRSNENCSLNINNNDLKAIEYYKNYFSVNNKFPIFSQILIETRTDCNRKCSFCPQAFKQRDLKEMDWAVFEEIINNLVEIGFSGRIAFFITNEPLIDNRLLDMISYAKKASGRFFLDINTNGNLLTLNLLDKLFSAGLDNINIEDYRADREQFPHKLSQNIERIFNAYIHNPKITYHYRSAKEVLSNRAGHVEKRIKSIHINSFCTFPFRKLAISPYGDVVICCMDYLYEVKFGNVMDKSLEEIWHSQALNEYRFMLLKGERKYYCKECDEYEYNANKSIKKWFFSHFPVLRKLRI